MKKHHTEEQVLGIMNEAELGKPLPELLRQHDIASGTFYRWKSRYGGLEPEPAGAAAATEAREQRAEYQRPRRFDPLTPV